jgi:hypothetical protein
MDRIYWRTDNPPAVQQYIVDMGANGLSWGWWDGQVWKKLWHHEPIDVVGWLPVPLYKAKNNG